MGLGNGPGDTEVQVDLGTLAPGQSETVTFRVRVDDPVAAPFVQAQGCAGADFDLWCNGYATDDPDTGVPRDPTLTGLGAYLLRASRTVKVGDVSGGLSGAGDPGGLLAPGAEFGFSATPLGDVDGDGVPDVAAGSPDLIVGTTVSPGVHLMLMDVDGSVKSNTFVSSSSADLVAALGAAGLPAIGGTDGFGSAIAPLGDLDGAGGSDFAIAVGASGGQAVYVLFLQASPLSVLSVSKIADGVGGFPGGQIGSRLFGRSLASLGDLDGDGLPELAVGAPGAGLGSAGGVWIVFLDASGAVRASPAPSSIPGGTTFGTGLAGLGPFDADATPDLAIGDPGSGGEGAVWIALLDPNGVPLGALVRIGDGDGGFPLGLLDDGGLFGTGDGFGSSVGSLPDLDENGTADLVVGAERDDDGASSAGAGYVLFLDSSTPTTPVVDVVKLSASEGALAYADPDAGDFLGSSAVRLGDLDGDGVEEIGLGARGDDDGVSGGGALYVVFPEIAPLCGNARVEDFEQCDDGGTSPVDGCNATCQSEDLVEISGLAQGGTVFFTVSGVALSVATTPGLSPADVVALMEVEIESNVDLIAIGVTGDVAGSLLATNGHVTAVSTDDPGLAFGATAVPVLAPAALLALVCGLGLAGAGALRARTRVP